LKALRRPPSVEGQTRDISSSGLALIVPVIRINDHYLAGEGRSLLLRLELPLGPLEIQATPMRYERLDETGAEKGYLIGVSITAMSDDDRLRYDEYIVSLLEK
jgi:PilZ domain